MKITLLFALLGLVVFAHLAVAFEERGEGSGDGDGFASDPIGTQQDWIDQEEGWDSKWNGTDPEPEVCTGLYALIVQHAQNKHELKTCLHDVSKRIDDLKDGERQVEDMEEEFGRCVDALAACQRHPNPPTSNLFESGRSTNDQAPTTATKNEIDVKVDRELLEEEFCARMLEKVQDDIDSTEQKLEDCQERLDELNDDNDFTQMSLTHVYAGFIQRCNAEGHLVCVNWHY